MTRIFTRIFRLKLILIALFLFCDFAIISQVNNNQKSGQAYCSDGDTIDYDQLQKVDFVEDGVHKTYYCDPAKNIVYNPYVNCYIVFNGGCQNEANDTAPANCADVEIVYIGSLPADFNQKILLAQQNGALSKGMEVNGASFQSRQPVQVAIPANYSRAYIRQQVGIPVKEMEAIMRSSMMTSHEMLAPKSFRASMEIPIWGVKRSSKPGGIDINSDIRGHRAIYEIERQRAIAHQEAQFKNYFDDLVYYEDLSQLKELKKEYDKGIADLWFWERLSDHARSLYTRIVIVNENLETVNNFDALRTIPFDEAGKLFSQLEEKTRADRAKLDQKNCSSCTKCNNERRKIDGIYSRAAGIIKAREEMQNKLIAEANRAILIRQAVIEKQEQERLTALEQQERLAREAELGRIENERLAQQEMSAKEAALIIEVEQAEQARQEQVRLAELARQEKLAREAELERVEKERVAQQERLAKEAVLKREYEQAEQARQEQVRLAELARQERLAREAELFERVEKERVAELSRQAKLAHQERLAREAELFDRVEKERLARQEKLVDDAALKKKHEIYAARQEKERLVPGAGAFDLEQLEKERQDLLSRQEKRDSLAASWREKLNGGGEDGQRYQNRIDALYEVGQPVVPVALSEHAYAMLEDFDLDQEKFKPFYDHAIQQVLENEFVTIANDVAPLYKQYRHCAPVHELHKLTIESVNIGRQYNELGMIEAASRIIDFCVFAHRVANDIKDGISDGLVQGAVNTGVKLVHMANRLKEAIDDPAQARDDLKCAVSIVGRGLAAVGKGFVDVLCFLSKVHDDIEAGRIKEASERWAPVAAYAKKESLALWQKCCQLSAYEASKGLVSFSTEFVLDILLQKKLCKVGGQFLTFASKQVRKVVIVEKMLTATEQLHALSKAKITKVVEQLGAFSKKKIAQLVPRKLNDEWLLVSSIEQVSGEAYESMRALEQLHLQNSNLLAGRSNIAARAATAGEPVETVAATVAKNAPVANIAPAAKSGTGVEKAIGPTEGSAMEAGEKVGVEAVGASKVGSGAPQGSVAWAVETEGVESSATINSGKTEQVVGGAKTMEVPQSKPSNDKKIVPASKTTLIDKQRVEAVTMELANSAQKELPTIKQIFSDCTGFEKPTGKSIIGKPIKVDINHIWEMELRWKGDRIVGMGGFHHDPNQVVEKSGVFEFTEKITNNFGCYKVKILHNGERVHIKSFFPFDWSHEKVASKIREAYNDFKVNKKKLDLLPGNKYYFIGATAEGLEIEFYATISGDIVSVYPLVK